MQAMKIYLNEVRIPDHATGIAVGEGARRPPPVENIKIRGALIHILIFSDVVRSLPRESKIRSSSLNFDDVFGWVRT